MDKELRDNLKQQKEQVPKWATDDWWKFKTEEEIIQDHEKSQNYYKHYFKGLREFFEQMEQHKLRLDRFVMDKRIEYLRGVTERVSKWTQLRNMNEPQDLYQVFDRLENFRQVLTQEINVMSEFKDHPLFSNKRFENRSYHSEFECCDHPHFSNSSYHSRFERCDEYSIKDALANYTCDSYSKDPLEQYLNSINYNPSLISRAFLSTSESDKLKELIFTAVNNCDSWDRS
ncbi:hypothetical protein C9374_010658 [Naegleria lovaniensis]|uniref:Uncharacterized protein n=1 Tax=Naegleria lovaniensis TaxID=51637 RepID=A0AA88GHF1_NAELO|nr:uncharacterized protein C9374_010658 [Naegleria lovaniensis]KAG2374639.1 hypothetical protein C9374_010658 [Naegleria lovaniensis]